MTLRLCAANISLLLRKYAQTITPISRFFSTLNIPITPSETPIAIEVYSGRSLSITSSTVFFVKLFIQPSSVLLSCGKWSSLTSSHSLRVSMLAGSISIIFTTLSISPGIIIHSIPVITINMNSIATVVPTPFETVSDLGIFRFLLLRKPYVWLTVKLYIGQSRYAITIPYMNGVSIDDIVPATFCRALNLNTIKNTAMLHITTRNIVIPHFICLSSKFTFIIPPLYLYSTII